MRSQHGGSEQCREKSVRAPQLVFEGTLGLGVCGLTWGSGIWGFVSGVSDSSTSPFLFPLTPPLPSLALSPRARPQGLQAQLWLASAPGMLPAQSRAYRITGAGSPIPSTTLGRGGGGEEVASPQAAGAGPWPESGCQQDRGGAPRGMRPFKGSSRRLSSS